MNEVFMIIMGMLFYVSMFILFYYFFIKPKREKKIKKTQDFFKALTEGLKTGSITTVDDIVNIYKGIAGLEYEDLDYRYGLSKQLREFFVELVSKRIDNSLDDEIIRKWKEKVSEFIRKNEEISPYADLPSTERNILNDISIFLEKNDIESIKRKTLELAGMIQARHDDLNKVRDINKWTVPLSIIGLILTIIFGFIAVSK